MKLACFRMVFHRVQQVWEDPGINSDRVIATLSHNYGIVVTPPAQQLFRG